MKKLAAAFVSLFAMLVFALPGTAFADKPDGGNGGKPDNPPCDADHGHPAENLARKGKDCPPGHNGGGNGGGPPAPAPADPCTAEAGDPGILTEDTLAQTLYDAGLSALSPLVEDPDADGPISGAIYDAGNGTALEPLTDEVACLVDLLIDPAALGFDL